MKILFPLLIFFLVLSSPVPAKRIFDWRVLRVGQSTARDAKKLLGKALQEYKEQLIYEKKHLDSGDPNARPIGLDTAVINLGLKGVIESIFLFPEWGTTDKQLKPLFGEGRKMKYRKFLSSMGKVKIGAGTRPDEKLHYINLDSLCEVYQKHRILVIYSQQDVVTGNYLVRLILFY
ncbi:MAG: hypothetical protein ACE5J1_06020 [Nitrospiria bacterium]